SIEIKNNNMLSNRLILFYLIGISFLTYLECQTTCKELNEIGLSLYNASVYANERHIQLDRYYYTQIVRFNQNLPNVSTNFQERKEKSVIFNLPFTFEFYGEYYNSISMEDSGNLFLISNPNEGMQGIVTYRDELRRYNIHIASDDKLLAIKWISKDNADT
ncbi:unnamed protein product, partial [Schistosoma turkestanicum]